jgi:hypothetical protein
MRRLGILAVGPALALLAAFAGCGGDAREPSAIGEEIATGDLALTVLEAHLGNPNEDGTFPVKVTIRLANTSDEPFKYSIWPDFALLSQGKDIDVGVDIFAEPETIRDLFGHETKAQDYLDDGSLAPGRSVEGPISFNVPSGMRELSLSYSPGLSKLLEEEGGILGVAEQAAEGEGSVGDLRRKFERLQTYEVDLNLDVP